MTISHYYVDARLSRPFNMEEREELLKYFRESLKELNPIQYTISILGSKLKIGNIRTFLNLFLISDPKDEFITSFRNKLSLAVRNCLLKFLRIHHCSHMDLSSMLIEIHTVSLDNFSIEKFDLERGDQDENIIE